jgi:hypothetical protein
MGIVGTVSTMTQLTSLGHAIFHLAMISEFGSLDEMVYWLDSLGSLQALPAQLFMLGLWMTALSYVLYLFAIFPIVKAGIITACAVATFGLGHLAISRVLQEYYNAVHEVSNGWRLSKRATSKMIAVQSKTVNR